MNDSEWRQVKFQNKPRYFKGHIRHWSVVCVICFSRYRNLAFHFKKYHPTYLERTEKIAKEALMSGEVGMINGFRFITSKDINKRMSNK